ncbi:MAG: serine--tRNA ligase [bacterium]|nr:serine--tRNA ligase [bacterium]
MLDIKQIREEPEEIRKKLLKRMDNIDFTQLLEWDKKIRTLKQEGDELKAERNKVSGSIPQLRKQNKPVQDLIDRMQIVSGKIKAIDPEIAEWNVKIKNFLDDLPNIPDEDVPAGGKENNKKYKEWGQKPEFDFKPLDHMELVKNLGLIDYERAVKMGGSGFWLYKGDGAVLEWGLLNYFVETHLKNGYELILPPHILTYQCGYTAGQFPKFEDDVFYLEQTGEKGEKSARQFILPTSETALVNFHRNEILKEEELPKKYFSYTPCYRKEAGSYRTKERGMIRGHQFNKVEMFQYTLPEQSEQALLELTENAESLVQGLGLHYQVALLAAKDCSASMAKTLDIEAWIPSMAEYKEVSSASNARDYQARRGNTRFKRKEGKTTGFVHTLNASGLATSRLIPAMLEQFQQKDGSVVVPEVLRKWVGKEILEPPAGLFDH